VDGANADYRLQPSSPFMTAATDGSMLGAEVSLILRLVPPAASPGRVSRNQSGQ
jgi:hypothetical protein